MHVFEVIMDNLASRTIGNHCYLLPISHPELQLVSCSHGAIFVDEFDRWILQTTDLKKAAVTLGIHKTHNTTILNHVIDKDNFQSYERALESSEVWIIWNTISNYFRDDKKTSSNPTDIVSLGYSGCNKQNISCLNRAKELQKKLQFNPYCYLVKNGAHAFLLVKHGKQQFLIDAGGAAVRLNYLSSAKTEKKAISSVTSKKYASLYLTSYQTLLEAFIESFKKKLAPQKPDFSQAFNKTRLSTTGVHCLIHDPIQSLKAIKNSDSDRAWRYFPDADAFLTATSGAFNSEITYIINLSPWRIADQGTRDTLRVKLHEVLIEQRDHLTIILLAEDGQGLLEDLSIASRIQYFYNTIDFIANTEKQIETPTLDLDKASAMALNISLILTHIKKELDKEQSIITLPIFYDDAEDFDSWQTLREIIQELELSGAVYANNQWYYYIDRNISIQLIQTPIVLEELKTIEATEQHVFLLTPHLSMYFFIAYLQKNRGSTLVCSVIQPLSKQVWNQLQIVARECSCNLVFIHPEHLSKPRITTSYQPCGDLAISEFRDANDLFLGSKLIDRLQAGESVVLHTNNDELLDSNGDLQQLLAPLLMGYAISPEGDYVTFSGKLSLVISEEDLMSKGLFCWTNLEFDQSRKLEKKENSVAQTTLVQLSAASLDQEHSLPDLSSLGYILPPSSDGRSTREKNVVALYNLLKKVNDGTATIRGALLSGPSAIAKTSMVKAILKYFGYSIVKTPVTNETKTAYAFRGTAKDLEIYVNKLPLSDDYQIIILDEINAFTEQEQQALARMLDYHKIFIIGTLNQGHYPGRESCVDELKEKCLTLAFNAYTEDEISYIAQMKLAMMDMKSTRLPTKIITSLLPPITEQLSGRDGAMRFFDQAVEANKDCLSELAVSLDRQNEFSIWKSNVYSICQLLETHISQRSYLKPCPKTRMFSLVRKNLDKIQDTLSDASKQKVIGLISAMCKLDRAGNSCRFFRRFKTSASSIELRSLLEGTLSAEQASFELENTQRELVLAGKIEPLIESMKL